MLNYNAFHNLESIGINGKTENLVAYSYKNGNGRLKSVTYANGHVMRATYNGIGQIVAEKWFENSTSETPIAHYKYIYDNDGNIVRTIDILSLKDYTYTYEEGKLTRSAESEITLTNEMVTAKTLLCSVIYSYDNEDNLVNKRILFADGSEQTIYYENSEDGNPVVKLSVNGKTVTSHSKNDSFGRKEFDELQIGKGFVSRKFAYHAGEVTEEHQNAEKVKSSPTTQLVSQIVLSDESTLSYSYDNEERITQVIYALADGNTTTTQYTYDALGQLVTEKVNEVTTKFEYDNYGNIFAKGVVDENGEIAEATKITYAYDDEHWHDLLTAYNGQAIVYDAQGNPTSYLGHTLTWEKGRQLKSFDSNTYAYNANGIRTSKTVNGVKHEYVLDGANILKETWENNTLIPMYDNEESVCGIIYNDVPYYFLKNLQGDVIAIINSDSEVVARYTYNAWGACKIIAPTNCAIAAINPYRYRGYYFDNETELYYLQSRYYDAKVGRFVNGDEVEYAVTSQENSLKHNIFAYCENQPVSSFDYAGCFKLSAIFPFIPKTVLKPSVKISAAKKCIAYNVPLYTQPLGSSLCWAYCYYMVESFREKQKLSKTEVKDNTVALAQERYGSKWNKGLPITSETEPNLMPPKSITVELLYELLIYYGPVYALYRNNKGKGHAVVVTGVDKTNQIIYTNNPWGVKGKQRFKSFKSRFATTTGINWENMKLYGITITI